MGGKTGTTTSSVSIPPEVLARYNAVNKTAEETAKQPFKQYSTDPNAFVAGINNQQQTGMNDISKYANYAQPILNDVQAGYTPEGYATGVQGYMNPYLQGAVSATRDQMNNINQQQVQQMKGSAIGQGAFGGDRANIGIGNLQNQQNLAMGQTIGNMESQGYQNAAQNYMSGLQNRGNFALQGQQAGVAGGQAELAAGTLAQQTEQAGKSALYNQFQQQQAYPFQVAQFLANIAEGTGALSGSNTTTTGPQSWFSDARLKHDIKQVGTAKNGLPIYTFKYKGDDTEQTHVGYMAQDVEKVHPEAVGESHGFKTVDYDKASKPVHRAFGGLNLNPAAALMQGGGGSSDDPEWIKNHGGVLPSVNHSGTAGDHPTAGYGVNHEYSPSTGNGGIMGDIGHAIGNMTGQITGDSGVGGTEGQSMYARGGVTNSEGGVVAPEHAAEGYFNGGDVINDNDLSSLLASQRQMYAPFEKGGLYGSSASGTPGGKGVVPAANLPVSHLAVANPARTQQGDTLMNDIQQAENIGDMVTKANNYRNKIIGHPAVPAKAAVPASNGVSAKDAVPAQDATGLQNPNWFSDLFSSKAHGGVVGYADGGGVEPYQTDDPMSQVVSDTEKDKNKHGLMTAQNPTGQPSSTLGDLSKIASIPGMVSGLGTAASAVGSGVGAAASGIADMLPLLFLKDGGVADREHHDGSEGNIVGGGSEQGDNVVGPVGPQLPNNPNYYKARALEIAKKTGISPEDFGKLGMGESGFVPHSGDDNSSAGVMQNHIGGASAQFPHGGRGDEYIAAHNPELAKTGSIGDKLAYLNAPETQIPQMEDAAQYIKEHGAKPWTVARQQGLFGTQADLPAAGGTPAQANVSPQGGFATPQGEEAPKKSIGDSLMSEQFLVPLLAGIGTMAGSNSRYLGSAILQGIGGGAKAYEDVQNNMMQRQLDQPIAQQRQMETVNALSTGLLKLNATREAQGLPPVSMEEFARASGYKGSLPEGVAPNGGEAQPTGAQNSSTPQGGYSYSIREFNNPNAIINRDGTMLPLQNDPLYLQQFITKNATAAASSPEIATLVQAANDRLTDINTRHLTKDVHGNEVPTPGTIAVGQQKTFADQQMETSKAYMNTGIEYAPKAANISKNLEDLETLYSQFRSGADVPARANFSRLMEAIDPEHKVPEWHNNNAASFETAQKGASALITQQLATMPAGAPRAELEVLARQIAQPNLQPEAVHHIISRAKAAVEYQRQMYDTYDPQQESYDVQRYQKKFIKDHPFNEFADRIEKETKPAAGSVQGGLVEGTSSTSKTGKPIIVRNGQWEYQ